MTPAIVEIEWIDSAAVAGWMSPQEREEWCGRVVRLRTVGYLVSSEAGCYTVATSWDDNQERCSGLCQIPKKIATSMRVLRKGKP